MKKLDLTPPSCYINTLPSREIICLLNSLTDYYSQTGRKYHAELIISNNNWIPVKEDGVTLGHKREDLHISLDGLTHVNIEDSEIIFKYKDKDTVKVPVTKDFFYQLEWDEDYYE